jgi:hypothetical protein
MDRTTSLIGVGVVAALVGLGIFAAFNPGGPTVHTLSGRHAAAANECQYGRATVCDVQADDGARLVMVRSGSGGVQLVDPLNALSDGGAFLVVGILSDGGFGVQADDAGIVYVPPVDAGSLVDGGVASLDAGALSLDGGP